LVMKTPQKKSQILHFWKKKSPKKRKLINVDLVYY
jgi:hypothetical protein